MMEQFAQVPVYGWVIIVGFVVFMGYKIFKPKNKGTGPDTNPTRPGNNERK